MNIDNFTLLEPIIKHAPLGMRFYDLAYSMNVTDGLNVTARPYGKPLPVLPAAHSPVSGIYGFYTLPGFRKYEFENEKDPFTDFCVDDSLPNWVISVEDTLGRFLPQVMPMCLPKKNLLVVPMYSNPARPSVAGYATVRGELWDETNNKPASWAVVSTQYTPGVVYSTVADGRGMFVLFLPYPKPSNGTLLTLQQWPLSFKIHYEPNAQRWLGQPEPETLTGETVEAAKQRTPPDSNTLLQQTEAGIFDIAAGANPTLTSSLRYRTDLVLKTRDKEPDNANYKEEYKIAKHRLWIAPA